MKKILYLALILVAWPALAQTVYRWVDKQGVVHYSDQPHKGAKAVQLGSNTTVLNFKTPPQSTLPPTTTPQSATAAGPSYQVKILAPSAGTTLRPVDYKVHVKVQVTPPLQGKALLQYQLDGKPVGPPMARTSLELQKVYRGTHTLTVQIVGSRGEVLTQQNSTFYVHQHSILIHPGRSRPVNSGGGGG